MGLWSLFLKPLDSPYKALLAVFIAWKSLLLLIAACSPGPGYDTSTTLVQPYTDAGGPTHVIRAIRLLASKLTRWDAIYFTKIAGRGYLYEQEWAFGWGFTWLIHFFSSDLKGIGFQDYEFLESFVGISLAHAAHGLSVLALYSLAHDVFPGAESRGLPFITACLHIFSPAGIFLSAPYGESTFALLSYSGCLLFVKSFGAKGQVASQDILIILSGLLLGFATTVRSNGLLSGLLFLEEVIRIVYSTRRGFTLPTIRRLAATGIGGVCIAIGFLLPQYIAFQEFCANSLAPNNPSSRTWCEKTLPSIYTFVQDHYWNVGLLRYWTLSNIPLFALATPMLIIMVASSFWAMEIGISDTASRSLGLTTAPGWVAQRTGIKRRLLRSLAIPQLLLAVMALTSYHVQIITRISSGYCIWYFWLAALLMETNGSVSMEKVPSVRRLSTTSWRVGESVGIVRYIVVYAVVQAGLFSSFLPPA